LSLKRRRVVLALVLVMLYASSESSNETQGLRVVCSFIPILVRARVELAAWFADALSSLVSSSARDDGRILSRCSCLVKNDRKLKNRKKSDTSIVRSPTIRTCRRLVLQSSSRTPHLRVLLSLPVLPPVGCLPHKRQRTSPPPLT
jgi:hypothetical protein